MASNGQKRQELIKAYPNNKLWAEKVNKMSDAQVVAIYLRLQRQGKIS